MADVLRVGDRVRITGLSNATHLNGKDAVVLMAGDDSGRVLIDVAEHPNALRLLACKLERFARRGIKRGAETTVVGSDDIAGDAI